MSITKICLRNPFYRDMAFELREKYEYMFLTL